ncbi:hypothetical protein [Actinomadura hibisca]|uniref:hypothetical protein n=1 Tax=Actinomadura hibisca TaxID=68565 RepID=UPI0008320756|nr:hypothetical protein [Actinomadura hibisca]
MAQSTTRSRAAALRAAREAKAARDQERRLREEKIEAALADFFEGSTGAARVRDDARIKAERIIADAEEKARLHEVQAARGVRALRGLEQTNAEIAELCGLSVAAVRALANDREIEPAPGQTTAGTGQGDASTGEHAERPGTGEVTGEGRDSEPAKPMGGSAEVSATWPTAVG